MDADVTCEDDELQSQSDSYPRTNEGSCNCADNYHGNDLNSADEHGNTPLHRAVKANNEEMVKHLLEHNDINVNCRNNEGETPLLLSIQMTAVLYITTCLIEAGADVNLGNNYGQTPLHIRMLSYREDVAHELIKCGANINARDQNEATPLHYAVLSNSFDAVCMLLYYGADVSSISCKSNTKPFIAAICYRAAPKIAKALYDYYDEFSEEHIPGFIVLHFATHRESCLPSNLIRRSEDVEYILFTKKSLLERGSSGCEEVQWFKSVWPMFNHRLILTRDVSILDYLLECPTTFQNFGTDWVNCMYLILNCPFAFDLLQHYRKYSDIEGCFYELIHAFLQLDVQLKDRMNIIYVCLSLGWKIHKNEIYEACLWYGFNDELESFFFCTSYNYKSKNYARSESLFLQSNFSFGLESQPSIGRIVKLLEMQFSVYYNKFLRNSSFYPETFINSTLDALGFFALPFSAKQDLLTCRYIKWKGVDPAKFVEKIKSVPELPSLVELCRNKTRRFINQTYKIKRAYQFDDILKFLNVPYSIRNILCFKTPIY